MSVQLLIANVFYPRLRMNLCCPQCLVSINITNPGDHCLVKKSWFNHRILTTTNPLDKILGARLRIKRLRSNFLHERQVFYFISRQQFYPTFGDEESRLILPAMAAARTADKRMAEVELSGLWPPDTLFHQAAGGRFDAVVSMYHDQGLIPFKLMHFNDGVNA